MESTRKMALVPQQLLSTLMAQQQLNPGLAQLSKVDAGMQNVLENSNLPPDIKHIQYNQMMHNYQTMRDHQLNKPMKIEVKSADSGSQLTIPDDDIIGGMPKKFRNKAKILLSHVKRAPNIHVDDKGQVVIDEKVIDDSNIMDLIFDYAKPKPFNKPPARGWREFGKALKQTNVPREAIVNSARWNEVDLPVWGVQQPVESPPGPARTLSFSDESADEDFATPRERKQKIFSFTPKKTNAPSPKKTKAPSPKKRKLSNQAAAAAASGGAVRRSSREAKPPNVYSPSSGTWRKYNQKK